MIQGARNIKIRTTDGMVLGYSRLDLDDSLDVARLLVADPLNTNLTALGLETNNPAIGDSIAVFGNSQGQGSITRLDGKVLGVGPDTIEVDAKFVQGNSGSPILNPHGNAVGIATYCTLNSSAQDWVASGTRFGNVRRFGVRLQENMNWVGVNPIEFYNQSNLIEDSAKHLENVFLLMSRWLYFSGSHSRVRSESFSAFVTSDKSDAYKGDRWEAKFHEFAKEYILYWKAKRIRSLSDYSLSQTRARDTIRGLFHNLLTPMNSELASTKWITKSLNSESAELQEYVKAFHSAIDGITKNEDKFWQSCAVSDNVLKMQYRDVLK